MMTYRDYEIRAKTLPFLFEWDYERHIPVITSPGVIPSITVPGYKPYVLGTHASSPINYDVSEEVRNFDASVYGLESSLLSVLTSRPHAAMSSLCDGFVSVFDGIMNRPRFILRRGRDGWSLVPVFTEHQLSSIYGLVLPDSLADGDVVDLSRELGLDDLFEFEAGLVESTIRDDEVYLAKNRPRAMTAWHVVDTSRHEPERIRLYALS